MILNSKGILQEFDLVIYPVNLVVAIGDMEKEINANYKPWEEEYNYIGSYNCPASTYRVRNKKTNDHACLIWFPHIEDVNAPYMAHESSHVAMEVFKYIGAKANLDDQEPFCYLLDAITRLLNKAFHTLQDHLTKTSKPKKKK